VVAQADRPSDNLTCRVALARRRAKACSGFASGCVFVRKSDVHYAGVGMCACVQGRASAAAAGARRPVAWFCFRLPPTLCSAVGGASIVMRVGAGFFVRLLPRSLRLAAASNCWLVPWHHITRFLGEARPDREVSVQVGRCAQHCVHCYNSDGSQVRDGLVVYASRSVYAATG
jgi:hypothetical protein